MRPTAESPIVISHSYRTGGVPSIPARRFIGVTIGRLKKAPKQVANPATTTGRRDDAREYQECRSIVRLGGGGGGRGVIRETFAHNRIAKGN